MITLKVAYFELIALEAPFSKCKLRLKRYVTCYTHWLELQKEIKVKELFKKKKGWKKKTWPATLGEVELLFAIIDIKVISRVLRMQRLTKEQLLWCEEKMSKLDLSENKLHRVGTPLLFPC
ncbi:hypothetical protein B296_00022638 [Ensete ventricosum]|uniref:Uncharacterized protein n=1 Tax=Ensete ventricosum TaxID=4639 RepID=A0A426Y3D6_ENSVE|nr:hypothetical protein B296_00022638 [Ensete ventricosum]